MYGRSSMHGTWREQSLATLGKSAESSESTKIPVGTSSKNESHKKPQSLAEEELIRLIKLVGLPSPELQYPFCPNRRFRADFAWVPYKLLAEVQGGAYVNGGHTRGAGFERDCERRSIAVGLGFSIIEVTPRQIRNGNAVRWVESALRTRGWTKHEST